MSQQHTIILTKWLPSSLVGSILTIGCGLLLWATTLGEAWENFSYDYLFGFGSHSITNQVALVLMDNESCAQLGQSRANWDRGEHTHLLNKLTDDGSRLVVFDVLFRVKKNPEVDAALAQAIRKNGHVILMANVAEQDAQNVKAIHPVLPDKLFLDAAAGYGVGHAAAESYDIVRRHWPFSEPPGEGNYHSLGWSAAQLSGVPLNSKVKEQWLRFYGENFGCELISYYLAVQKPNGYFHNKIVFIGNWPSEPNDPAYKEDVNDKFRTPYTHWNGKAVGGAAIMATTFLNLVKGDWLRRPPQWFEILFLIFSGLLIGGGLCQMTPWKSFAAAVVTALTIMLFFVSLSYFTNYWFPWAVIAGGQVPCALIFSLAHSARTKKESTRYPGYVEIEKPFGAGAYGKVLLVRNEGNLLEALKDVERKNFGGEIEPYEREFYGIKTYMPISHQHIALLQVKHVRRFDNDGYFFYVMELSDPLDPDWTKKNEPFRPLDLRSYCTKCGGRLSVAECFRIGIALTEALKILHESNLVHRDVKPANVVFVNGRPKLADIGLVREAISDGNNATQVYTPDFNDPLGLGTKQADLYALGITLYVVSTGNPAKLFSEISPELAADAAFMRLNEIICKMCTTTRTKRFTSATEILEALHQARNKLNSDDTVRIENHRKP
jgi:CHASE2 domain-containing sensor protein